MQLSRRFAVLTTGQGFSKRVFLQDKAGQKQSPWHHLDLPTGLIVPGVIEISRHQIAKYEVSLKEPFNPIKQDTRKNKRTGVEELRFYGQFPLFNYGCIPQTWENSLENDPKYPYKGDGDPLDIVEIGEAPLATGSVADVKVIGALCLVDSGEADWKVVCVNTQDSHADQLNCPEDVDRLYPGKLAAIRHWFEVIKTFDGKPRNRFEGASEGPAEALALIAHCHKQWQRVKTGEFPSLGYWLGGNN